MKKYFRTFDTHSEYEAFTGTSEFILPNVSWCRDDIYTVHYTPTVDVTGVTLNESTLSLSEGDSATLVATVMPADATHKDVTWNSSDESVATVSSGGVVTTVGTGSCTITVTTVEGGFTAQCEVSVIQDYLKTYLTFIAVDDVAFKFSKNSINYSLDNGNTWTSLASNTYSPTVTAGSKIMWKATLTPSGVQPYGIGNFSSSGGSFTVEGNVMSLLYGDNFVGQTSLTTRYGVRILFSGDTNIISAENLSLPATEIGEFAYNFMFDGCTNLIKGPKILPATTLGQYCYQNMFNGCTSLTVAPSVLPATTLASNCYTTMFQGCTSLTTAPELPATTLANNCYQNMFRGCTSLTTAPELPATTLANYCYDYMFYGCTSLTTAPELPATTLVSNCYRSMFRDCTSLNYIKAMFTTTPNTYITGNWVNGVASSGTFVKNSAATWTSSCGTSTYPCNWTIETASS